jgi:hypothetical protein
MAAKLKYKRTSITAMQTKFRSLATFHSLINSHSQNYSKMAANLREKRMSITAMGAKTQAFDIFQTPLSSHYPLPLREHFL